MNFLKTGIESVKPRIQPYYILIANFGYLSLLQIFNLALPLLTYPYLIRVLGKEAYGMVIYSQAIVSYLVVFVNFGFNITATKDISVHRDNPDKLTEIASSIFTVKAVLFLATWVIMFCILQLSNDLQAHKSLFYLTLWMCLNEFLFPLWYFQGTEKMKYITLLTLASRMFFLVFIFLLVRSDDDYLLVPIINGVGSVISCGIALLILRKSGVGFKFQPLSTLIAYVKNAYIMALSYGANIFKTNFSVIVVKHFFSLNEVVYFDLAMKIINLGITFLDLISQAVFPRMSRLKDTAFLKKIIGISLIASVVLMTAVQVFAPFIVRMLGGNDMIAAVQLTRVMAANLPVYIVGALLGRNCLLVYGYDKPILSSMAYSALLYLLLIVLYASLYKTHDLVIFAYIYLISFLFESVLRYQACLKRKLL